VVWHKQGSWQRRCCHGVQPISVIMNLKACPGLCKKAWNIEAARASFVNLMNSADQVTRAHLLAAATKESRMWLHAVPVTSLGTQLDPKSLWVAVALRVGASVCEWHKCRCSSTMDILDTIVCHAISVPVDLSYIWPETMWSNVPFMGQR